VRAVLYVVFLPGILWAAVSRRNASIQDLIVGTAVVYDWGPAAARVAGTSRSEPSPARSEPSG
jgi:uncharacterized RDD family membrane protein YckC